MEDPTQARTNHIASTQESGLVDDYLVKEIDKGGTLGPFASLPFRDRVGMSPMNTRAREDEPSRLRVILDLSYPPKHAVNDGIPADSYLGDPFELKYPTTDELANRIMEVGRQCVIYKRDLVRWLNQLPVCLGDVSLLGMQWHG